MRPRLGMSHFIPKAYRPLNFGNDKPAFKCESSSTELAMGRFAVIGEVEGFLFRVGRWSEVCETQVCQVQGNWDGTGDRELIYTSLYERSGLDLGSKADTRRPKKTPAPFVIQLCQARKFFYYSLGFFRITRDRSRIR